MACGAAAAPAGVVSTSFWTTCMSRLRSRRRPAERPPPAPDKLSPNEGLSGRGLEGSSEAEEEWSEVGEAAADGAEEEEERVVRGARVTSPPASPLRRDTPNRDEMELEEAPSRDSSRLMTR